MTHPLQCESTQDVIKKDERSAGSSVVRQNFWIGLVCLMAALSFTAFEASAQNFKVTVKFAGNGSGKITIADDNTPPNESICESDCTKSFPSETGVTLTATPNSGSAFANWQGTIDCDTDPECTLVLDADITITANFNKQSGQVFTLTISKAGAGGGTVTSSDNKINCGSTCSATYDAQAQPHPSITLQATPDANSDFTGWSGGGCSGTSNCTTTMDSNKMVTATFAPKAQTFSLTVSKAGTGGGTVTSNEATPLIDCGTTCSADYASGATVTLKATPDASSNFTGWSGACTGTGDCPLTMDAAKQVTATFAPKAQTFALKVTKAGTGSGTVTSSPAAINCGQACTVKFATNTVVTLTATPATGSIFGGWSGACTGTGTCKVTMNAAKSVTATFTVIADLVVTQTAAPNPVTIGANLTYTINVNDSGPASAAGVVLKDSLPTNASFVSAMPNSCTPSSGTITCNIGNLKNGVTAIITIVVKVTVSGTLKNTASVTSSTTDPNTSNNSSTLNITAGSSCADVAAASRPTSLSFTPTPTQAVKRNITVTISNKGTTSRTVTAITPLAGQPFTIVSISPKLPVTLRRGTSVRLIVQTRRAAGLPSATATRPYFTITVDCGALTSASVRPLPILLDIEAELLRVNVEKIESLQLQIFDLRGHVWVNQRGANNAFVASMIEDSLAMLPNGVYLYLVNGRNKKGEVTYSEARKVVVVR